MIPKMFRMIAVSVLMIGLSACQTAGIQTLDSAFIQSHGFGSKRTFISEYEQMNTGRVLAISKTDGYLYYRYYLGTVMRMADLRSETLKMCAIKANEECVILAYNNDLTSPGIEVVKAVYGDKSGATSNTAVSTSEPVDFSDMADKNVCGYAVHLLEWNIKWYPEHVTEAKARGFTPETCKAVTDP